MHEEDAEGTLRQKLHLTGDIEIGWKGSGGVHLTGILFETTGDAMDPASASLRLTLEGLLAALRTLAAQEPPMAALMEHVKDQAPDVSAKLALDAPRALLDEIARAIPADKSTLQEFLEIPAWTALAFALDRYLPYAIGIVTSESVSP